MQLYSRAHDINNNRKFTLCFFLCSPIIMYNSRWFFVSFRSSAWILIWNYRIEATKYNTLHFKWWEKFTSILMFLYPLPHKTHSHIFFALWILQFFCAAFFVERKRFFFSEYLKQSKYLNELKFDVFCEIFEKGFCAVLCECLDPQTYFGRLTCCKGAYFFVRYKLQILIWCRRAQINFREIEHKQNERVVLFFLSLFMEEDQRTKKREKKKQRSHAVSKCEACIVVLIIQFQFENLSGCEQINSYSVFSAN